MSTSSLVLLTLLVVPGLLAVAHALARGRGVRQRLGWAAVAAVPVLGPLVYVCWREPPTSQSEEHQARHTDFDPSDFG